MATSGVMPAIDPGRIASDLADLISIPSVTGDEHAVQDHMAGLMVGAGLDVTRLDVDHEELAFDPGWPGSEMPRQSLPLVAGTWRGIRPGPRILFVGHVDVVPAGDPRTWSNPPFEPLTQDGQIYGRGACDMKGGVVAALEAVRGFAESGPDFGGEVVLLTVPSEEDGGGGALAAIRAGFTGDMAVIPEPTRLEVVTAHAGAITFTLDVPGKAAHASTPLEGVSALDKVQILVAALARDERERNDSERNPLMRAIGLPYPTIIGKVHGGDWASTVLDRVVVEGRYGVRLGQSVEEAEADLHKAIGTAWRGDDFLSHFPVRLEVTGGRLGSADLPNDHPLPGGLAAAAERVTGTRPALVGVPYGADMRLFINEGNTPCVMYGPGDVRVAHSADERVALHEVETCARVLAHWLATTLG